MPDIDLRLDADTRPWKDIDPASIAYLGDTCRMVLIRDGMASGKHAVAIGVELPDGRYGVIQTSFELLNACVRAMGTRVEMEGGEWHR